MGVKLQLLLGLLLIGSICGSDKISHSQNASLEKVDSTTNLLEKLPKTDTQINLVKKDTQDIPDSSKYSEYSQENDTHENKTSSHEDLGNIEKSGHARKGNSRSIDIEKFDSHDFQNNDFGLSDDQKVQENSVRKASTKGYINLSNFQLTTSESSFDTQNQLSTPTSFFDATHNLDHPKSQLTTPENFFDGKVDEDNQKLETSYDGQEHLDHHPFHDDDDDIENDENENHEQDHDNHFQKLFGESKSAPNSTLTYKEKTKISKNNTVGDNSEYNELRVEKSHNINYASTYDFTSSDGDVTEKVEELETTSPRGFTDTTKRTTTVTKSSTSQSSHILSNKIETETIKAINSLTTEYSTTKRLKEENNLIPKEQTVEENKIIPLEAIVPMTTKHIVKNKNDTTEQTKEINSNPTDQNINFDNITQKSIEQITVTNSYTEITTTERVNNINMKEFETTTVLPLTNEQTTIIEDNSQKTTEDNITYIPTTQYIIEATTMNEVQKETNGQEDTTEQSTPQQITTETINRISKAFSFGSTHTLNSETTELYTETMEIKLSSPTSEADNTTPSMTIIVTGTETEATNPITNTENETTVATETNNETTTVATKTEEETTTSHTAYTGSETTTKIMHIPKIIQTTTLTPMTTGEMETSTDRSKLDTTTLNYPFPTNITVIPVSMNVTDETTVHSTTDDFPESSSAGADAGNLGSGEENKGKIAAIIISTVGAVCLILLAGLLYIMRKRQRRFNYKQRCRPVGLDDYSVDNVSGYNSTRRKAERQSKRSYGNPAFDDPVAVTHPLNFPALAKFATNLEEVKAEFGEIPQITAKTYELPEGCEIKNRYANVIPLPETRVFLQPIDGYPNSDYINANYVTGPKNTKGYYIACQAPISNTVDDFWRMIWEQQTKVILMLTHLFENGIEKCVDYLPPSEVLDCNRLFGDFQVTLKKRDVKEKYIISNLQLKNMVSNSWREITHFWYLGWPDKGVPSEENSIIAFLIEARSYMKSATLDKNAAMNGNMNGSSKNEINPVVVHCSPGTGRTGVVLACDIAIREFEQSRLVDIPKIVYRIRRDRASAVQTKEQYLFIYKVVNLYATKLTGGALESL